MHIEDLKIGEYYHAYTYDTGYSHWVLKVTGESRTKSDGSSYVTADFIGVAKRVVAEYGQFYVTGADVFGFSLVERDEDRVWLDQSIKAGKYLTKNKALERVRVLQTDNYEVY